MSKRTANPSKPLAVITRQPLPQCAVERGLPALYRARLYLAADFYLHKDELLQPDPRDVYRLSGGTSQTIIIEINVMVDETGSAPAVYGDYPRLGGDEAYEVPAEQYQYLLDQWLLADVPPGTPEERAHGILLRLVQHHMSECCSYRRKWDGKEDNLWILCDDGTYPQHKDAFYGVTSDGSNKEEEKQWSDEGDEQISILALNDTFRTADAHAREIADPSTAQRAKEEFWRTMMRLRFGDLLLLAERNCSPEQKEVARKLVSGFYRQVQLFEDEFGEGNKPVFLHAALVSAFATLPCFAERIGVSACQQCGTKNVEKWKRSKNPGYGRVLMTPVTGEFYLEKATFAPGEPVFLYLKLVNYGRDTVKIFASNPEQPFCSGNSITVLSDSAVTPQCPSFTDSGCVTDGPLSTPSQLPPGRSRVERFLLNFNHDISAPGGYWVEAKRGDPGEAYSKLHFQVDSNLVFPSRQLASFDGELCQGEQGAPQGEAV